MSAFKMHLLLPGLRLYLVFGISGQAERAEAPSYSRAPIGLLAAPLRPRLVGHLPFATALPTSL